MQLDRLVNKIYKELDEHNDPRIKNLMQSGPDTLTTAILFAPHLDGFDDFNIRYLSPGRSGANVILIVAPQKLPIIIKYGEYEDIKREKDNYDNIVKRSLPSDIKPELFGDMVIINQYASIPYSWAGNYNEVETFRSFFKRKASIKELQELLTGLISEMFKWHAIQKFSILPFDQWEWVPAAFSRIENKISSWDRPTELKGKLINAMNIPLEWRDHLNIMHCSKGKCHGDMNCHNILIAKRISGYSPLIIDFASVRTDSSPARDWAKLERDIKFRCFRDQVEDPARFRNLLTKLDDICYDPGDLINIELELHKPAVAISTIRKEYLRFTANISNIPLFEYLYYLFCSTLSYLDSEEGREEALEVQNAIIDSAYRTLELIDLEINPIRTPITSNDEADQHVEAEPTIPFNANHLLIHLKLNRLIREASYASILTSSPDADWLATLHANRTVHLWAMRDLRKHIILPSHNLDGYLTSSAMRKVPEGWELIVGLNKGFERWLIGTDETCELIEKTPYENLVEVRFSGGGSEFLTVSRDGFIEIRRADDGSLVKYFHCPEHLVTGAFCNGNRYVIGGSELGRIFIWDMATEELIKSRNDHRGMPISAMIGLDSSALYMSSGEDGALMVFRCPYDIPLAKFQLSEPIICATWDRKLIFAGLKDNKLIAHDISFKKEYWRVDLSDQPASLAIVGGQVLAVANYDRKIEIRNINNGQLLHTLIGFGAEDWIVITSDKQIIGKGFERFLNEQ